MSVIKIENLGKKYIIGHQKMYRSATFRDAMTHAAKSIWQKFRHPLSPNRETTDQEEIWALKDVNFEVEQGERLGIIGRNGAGKSTLLKVLSRITEPTIGTVRLKGRVSSLLEVGTGFHRELTGRENIFLNGAILGMTRQEIKSKFDEIIAFAEIEKFLDTPVKRYSSGMYVRLAFAVAAHLEPEILIVDEVLAVGDVSFQKKCLGKMENVANEGRTVLFVSHNMAAVSALCPKSIILKNGKIEQIGETSEIISEYLSSFQEASQYSLQNREDRSGNGKARINSLYLAEHDGKPIEQVISGYQCMFVLGYESVVPLSKPIFKFTIYNSVGQALTHFDSSLVSDTFHKLPKRGFVGCRFEQLPLSRGTYRINVSITNNSELLDHVVGAYSFFVSDGDFFGTGRSVAGLTEICLVNHDWMLLNNSNLLMDKKL